MHIVVIPSWYTDSYNKLRGIFFKEQAEALLSSSKVDKVGVVTTNDIGLKSIIDKKELKFGLFKYRQNGVNNYVYQIPDILRNKRLNDAVKLYLFKRVFRKYIKEHGLPDIVHLHSFYNGLMAKWIKKEYNIAYVTTEHASNFLTNSLDSYDIKKASSVFNESSLNIAVSQNLADILQVSFKKEFAYIPNFVVVPKIKPKTKFKKFTFVNVGFLTANKNQKLLIKSFYKAFKNKEAQLIIIGDGKEYNSLKSLIKELNLEQQVMLYGKLDREKVFEVLNSSHVYLHASLFETFGIAIIEALSCGLPVISTKSGGPEGIITNSRVGKLINADENELQEAMIELFNNYSSYNANSIKEFYLKNFSKEVVVKKIVNNYCKVLNRG